MSTKRQPSKQRRQSQNQRQRAALEARRAAAAAGRQPGAGAGGTRSGATSSAGGSLLSRLRGSSAAGRAVRTGGRTTTPTGLPVGHRAAMSALLAAIAAAVIGSFVFRFPVDRTGDAIGTQGALIAEWSYSALEEVRAAPTASAEDVAAAVGDWAPGGEEPYAQALWPFSLGVLLPVLGAGLAFRAVSKGAPAKVVNRTMYVTLFGTLLAAQLLILFLPAVIGVGVAAFQVRKAEVAAQMAAAEDAQAAGGDEAIEVDEVDGVDEVDDAQLEDEASMEDEVLTGDAGAVIEVGEVADDEDAQRG